MFTSEQIESICTAWLSGKTPGEIARQYNTTKVIIGHITRKEGVNKCTPLSLSEKGREKIIKNYLEGKSTSKMAIEYDMSTESICEILERNNIPRDYDRSIYSINHNAFENIDTEEQAYWLGFLYADGYNKENGSVQLALKADDVDHLNKFKEFLEYTGVLYKHKTNGSYSLQVHSKQMSADLLRHGVMRRKTFICKFPDLKKELVPHFIRGYFDGDGYVSKNRYSLEIISNEFIINSIIDVLKKEIDIKPSRIQNKNKATNIYTITYSNKKNILAFYNYIYHDASVCLERKRDRFINLVNRINKTKIKT